MLVLVLPLCLAADRIGEVAETEPLAGEICHFSRLRLDFRILTTARFASLSSAPHEVDENCARDVRSPERPVHPPAFRAVCVAFLRPQSSPVCDIGLLYCI